MNRKTWAAFLVTVGPAVTYFFIPSETQVVQKEGRSAERLISNEPMTAISTGTFLETLEPQNRRPASEKVESRASLPGANRSILQDCNEKPASSVMSDDWYKETCGREKIVWSKQSTNKTEITWETVEKTYSNIRSEPSGRFPYFSGVAILSGSAEMSAGSELEIPGLVGEPYYYLPLEDLPYTIYEFESATGSVRKAQVREQRNLLIENYFKF